MDTNIKKTKELLLASQKGIGSKEKIINDIVDGVAELLSISDLSERLSISRDVIIGWIKNTDPNFKPPKEIRLAFPTRGYYEEQIKKSLSYKASYSKDTYFPIPDIYVGNEPRWEKGTIKNWLHKCNEQKKAE